MINTSKAIRVEILIHFLLWTTLVVFELSQVMTIGPFRKQDGSIYPPLIWNTIFSIGLFYSNTLYLIPRYFAKQRYKTYFILVLVLYVLIVSLNTSFDHYYAISLFSSEKEPISAELSLNAGSKMFILSLSMGYGLSKNWVVSNKREQRYAAEKLKAELKYLKAQINPHFLFNTLNMAYASAVKSNDEATADIIEKISGFMRYVLYENNDDWVSLTKELHYIDNYINLQIQRLSPEIASQIRYEVTGDPKQFQIAPMILIPFIENVFKHGVMLTKKPEMLILIEIHADRILLTTKNLKKSTPKIDDLYSGIGMKNATDRLHLLYPRDHTLHINDGEKVFEVNLEMLLTPSTV